VIELVRIVENQASLSSYRATQNEERALQLELMIESTKPKNHYGKWHTLIATPFRYPPPHPQARFRPPYGKNVFYGSLLEETALYEHAFHFMKQRMHLHLHSDTGTRTIFFVDANNANTTNLSDHSDRSNIMSRHDYSHSHQFIIENPKVTFIIYPSCRDPQQRDNAAVLDINHLHTKPKWESTIKFFYDNQTQLITWLDYDLHIRWQDVAAE